MGPSFPSLSEGLSLSAASQMPYALDGSQPKVDPEPRTWVNLLRKGARKNQGRNAGRRSGEGGSQHTGCNFRQSLSLSLILQGALERKLL